MTSLSANVGAIVASVLIIVISILPINVQSQNTESGQWHFLAEPYVMFPYMNGTSGVGNLPKADVDADPGDIFSKLQIGAMLYSRPIIFLC